MSKRLLFSLVCIACFSFISATETPNIKGKNIPSFFEQSTNAFTTIAEKAMPATVFLKVQVTQQENDRYYPFDFYGDEFFRRYFGAPFLGPQTPPETQTAGGSGFLISSDGYIVTNHHVIKDGNQITAVLNDGREYPASVKGIDSRSDLALLKIEEKNLPFLTFGDSDSLKVGEWVVAIGNPFGLEATLTAGIVSAKGRQDIGLASYEDFIQTDAAINPGNSGGPLLNLKGEVVGVNTAIFSRTGGHMGIGFSIPSKMAQHATEQLLTGGHVKRAYLGIILQPIDKNLAEAQGLEKQEGVLISEVLKDSPAAKGGIHQGDIILQYGDKVVKNVTKFRNDIALMKPGTELNLKVLRNNKPLSLNIQLGAQSDGQEISTQVIQKLGIDIENLSADLAGKLGYSSDTSGVVISKVKPNSPAAKAGLRPSFLITGIAITLNNQKKITNIDDFEKALQDLGDKKHITLIVRNHNSQHYFTIKLN